MTALSGGAPEQAPRWDLVDTESYGGGIRFLAPYLDLVRSKNHVPEGFIPFGLRLIFLFFETLK